MTIANIKLAFDQQTMKKIIKKQTFFSIDVMAKFNHAKLTHDVFKNYRKIK